MHEVAAETEAGSNRYHVPFFNPGKNRNQESKLRVINPGSGSATVDITGVDDDGRAPRLGTVQLTLRAGSARTLTAYELENGSSKFSGRLGAGTGKWRLSVSADRPIMVMSLLELPQGHLTNLSRGQPGVSVPPPPSNEPDLVVESPSASPTTPSAGQLVLLSATVRNQGGAQAPATRLRFYRSSDATITRTDSALQTASVRALPPSDTVNSSISVNASSAAGTYYYGACVDSVQRESDTANNCSGAVGVTVPGSGGRIGALAVGWKTGRCRDGYGWGLALNAPDSGTAFASAVSNCQSLGLVRCSRRVWFSHCGALAYGTSSTGCNALGGWGATKSAAELTALSECRKNYSGCRVSVSDSGTRASYCNRGVGSAPAPAAQSGMISSDSPLDAGHSEATSVPKFR